MSDHPPISDEYAAELVANMQGYHAQSPHLTGVIETDYRDLLILKLWSEVQSLKAATAFFGGIKPVQRGQ